jgi:hypothetical protein
MPGNAPLGLEPFEVTDKEHPEINTWRNGRTSALGKVWGAFLFKPGVETIFLEKLLSTNQRNDFENIYPKWFIEIIKT